MKKIVRGTPVAVVAIIMLLAQPLGAHASESSKTEGRSTGMTVRGFDAEVAAKNGFAIVTDEQGVQESVPVSNSAKALVAAAAQDGHLNLGKLTYSCGSSWLNMTKAGSTSVYFNTGFKVYLPTLWHSWAVDMFSSRGGYSEGLDGGPTPPVWDDGWTVNVGSNVGTHGNVRPGSLAVLTNGAVCYSNSPTSGT